MPVADKLAPHLDKLLEAHPEGRLFIACGDYNDKHAHYFLNVWNKHAKRVGDYSFHCWRTYANTRMLEAGVEVVDRERILGHKVRDMQGAYTPADMKRFKVALDRVP